MAVTYERLGDIADISAGGTPSRSNESYWKNGKIPWVKISDIKGKYLEKTEEYITEEGLNHSSTKLFKKGTLLYTIFATIGECTILNIDASTNQAIAGINVKRENVLNEYLYYFLSSIKNIVIKTGRGVAQNNINLTILKKIKVPVPEVEVQKKIINVLNKSNELVIKRKAQIEALDQLTQSVFLEMFGDPVTNTKSYPIQPLREFGTVITGNTPSRKKPEYYGDYIEWIKSDNINTPFHFLTRAEEYLSELGKNKGRVVPANSILVTCIAGSQSSIGNAAIADRSVAFNQQINAIVPNKNINVYFLYTQFLVGKRLVQQASTNSMKGLVSKSAFEQIIFINPPYRLQEKFGEIFEQVEEQKSKLLKSLTLLEGNYNSIMQRAFKGELFTEEKVFNL